MLATSHSLPNTESLTWKRKRCIMTWIISSNGDLRQIHQKRKLHVSTSTIKNPVNTMLSVSFNGTASNHDPNPKYVRVTLDRSLNLKTPTIGTAAKIHARNKIWSCTAVVVLGGWEMSSRNIAVLGVSSLWGSIWWSEVRMEGSRNRSRR